ncbi:DUF6415 family natural product biosynthesis protein [Streptomyces caeruleatus]|uniref:Uncharacterized protein n=1 Tax=Streptomyces caeruleatus TaxID=661399 RepID=A0A101TGJ1_9ACTN|nr:DUF6415 family natural product biosynthesis protein [Streptomyces caeruleatus]KUN91907.1 hypothetical protein AQJ67_41495 [Streptomyces caeruleatus]
MTARGDNKLTPSRLGFEARPVNATQEQTDCSAPTTATMRAAATWFLDQPTLPRHESLKLWHQDLGGFLRHLMPAIEALAADLPENDVPARVAMVGVGEARRRLHEPEAAGLLGEAQRVQRMARSVVALCDHHDALAGMRMCLACDKPIEDGETWLPYDKFSPSGGAAQSGRIHASCASVGRPRR